tara:strand:- start:324 stop:518 length:195 start_codon:yes stop_codon:yes gene_type:complete
MNSKQVTWLLLSILPVVLSAIGVYWIKNEEDLDYIRDVMTVILWVYFGFAIIQFFVKGIYLNFQ